MNTKTLLVLALSGLALGGCAKNVGWVIKPVPIDERLQETVVAADAGLFVSDKIAIVDVDGLLLNQRRTGWLAQEDNPVSLFVEKLDRAQADPAVKALVVRINSPGGGVTASDIMHHRLMQFREARKAPVVAVIQDIGASGAYYIACGADKILAHPTSVTGSIGVIVQTISLAGTMQKLGIDAKAVVSGPMKDMASPFKPLEGKDLAVLQGLVDDFYGRFLEVVAAGRPNLDADRIKTLADGRVYSGRQAKDNGLVDELGYMSDGIALARQAAGLKAVKVVMYHRPLGYRENYYSAAPGPTQINLLNVAAGDLLTLSQPQIMYLWTGQAGR